MKLDIRWHPFDEKDLRGEGSLEIGVSGPFTLKDLIASNPLKDYEDVILKEVVLIDMNKGDSPELRELLTQ
jgi:hypothetical protein